MSDMALAVILVAFFLLAIGLIRVLDRLIDRDANSEEVADEPPDTGAAGTAEKGSAS
jgi:hypothetical protein